MNLLKKLFTKQKAKRAAGDTAWIFFNCDEHKTWQSMNPSYNDTIYDGERGRKLLWAQIEYELNNKAIIIEKNNIEDVKHAILEGDPLEANDYITYGYIAEMEYA